MSNSASMQVRIGADIRDLEKGLSKVQSLVDLSTKGIARSGAATERSAEQQRTLNKEIDAGNRLIRDMISLVDMRDKNAVRGAQAAIDAQRKWLQEIGGTVGQYAKLEQSQKALDAAVSRTASLGTTVGGVSSQLETMRAKAGPAFNAILYGAGQVANGTDSAVRAALRSVSTFAYAFGPKGMIVAAMGAGASFIYDYFQKARDQMSETARKFEEELARMSRVGGGGLIAKEKLARDVWLGDPAKGASKFAATGFTGGLADLKGEQAHLQERLAGGLPFREARRATKRLVELAALIKAMEAQIAAAMKSALGQPSLPSDITGLPGVTVSAKHPNAKPKKERGKTPLEQAQSEIAGLTMDGAAELALIKDALGDVPDFVKKMEDELKTLVSPEIKNVTELEARAKRQLARDTEFAARKAQLFGDVMQSATGMLQNAVSGFLANKFGGGAAGFGASLGQLVGAGATKLLGGTLGKIAGTAIGGPIVGALMGGVGGVVGGLVGKVAGKIGGFIGGIFGKNKKKADKSADALDKLAESTKKANEAMLNVPSWYKVNAAILAAIDPNNAPGGGGNPRGGTGPYTPPAPPPDGGGFGAGGPNTPGGEDMPAPRGAEGFNALIVTGDLIVQSNDPDEMYRKVTKKIEQEGSRGGPSPLAIAIARNLQLVAEPV